MVRIRRPRKLSGSAEAPINATWRGQSRAWMSGMETWRAAIGLAAVDRSAPPLSMAGAAAWRLGVAACIRGGKKLRARTVRAGQKRKKRALAPRGPGDRPTLPFRRQDRYRPGNHRLRARLGSAADARRLPGGKAHDRRRPVRLRLPHLRDHDAARVRGRAQSRGIAGVARYRRSQM